MANMENEDYMLFSVLFNVLGAEQFLDELCKAMSNDELRACMEYIARNNDINVSGGGA